MMMPTHYKNAYKYNSSHKPCLSIKEDEYQRGLIITDDIAVHPILDFNLYANAIVKIIRDSYKFGNNQSVLREYCIFVITMLCAVWIGSQVTE
jgi:hypothetical protein